MKLHRKDRQRESNHFLENQVIVRCTVRCSVPAGRFPVCGTVDAHTDAAIPIVVRMKTVLDAFCLHMRRAAIMPIPILSCCTVSWWSISGVQIHRLMWALLPQCQKGPPAAPTGQKGIHTRPCLRAKKAHLLHHPAKKAYTRALTHAPLTPCQKGPPAAPTGHT